MPKHIIKPFSAGPLLPWYGMAVNVGRGGRLFVAQALLDHMKLFADSQHQASVGVAQDMKAKIREVGKVSHLAKAAGQVTRVDRLAVFLAKDRICS